MTRLLQGESFAEPTERVLRLARIGLSASEALPPPSIPHARFMAILGDHGGAITLVRQRATRLDHESTAFLRELAAISAARNDLAEAERALLFARELDGTEPATARDLAALFIAQGETGRALRLLSALVELRPADPTLLAVYAGTLLQVGRGDDALARYRLRVDLCVREASCVGARLADVAEAELELGRHEDAIRSANAALAAARSERALLVVGLASIGLGDHVAARAALTQIEAGPTLPRAQAALAVLSPTDGGTSSQERPVPEGEPATEETPPPEE